MFRILYSLCFSLLLMSSVASAQVVVEMSSSTNGEPTGSAPDRMYIKDNMTRVDSQTSAGNMSTIFRGEDMLMLNHDARTYNVFGREQVRALGDKMNEARKQMEEQLADLPPQQRAMVEKMMGDRMAAAMGSAPEPLRVERGGTGQAGNYSCTEYMMYRGEEKRFEICAASTGELGPAADEARAALEAMAGFMEEIMQSFNQGPLAGMMESPFQAMSEIDGFPVLTRRFNGDEVIAETMLTSIGRGDVDDGLFSPPDDYTRQEIEGMSP